MPTYGINFKHDNTTIAMEADWYEIRDGFVRLIKDGDIPQEFAAYASDEVRHIVLQKEYTEEEILAQIKESRSTHKDIKMYEITVKLDDVIQWTVQKPDRMSESDHVELTQTRHAYLGREYSLFGIPLYRGKGFFLGDMELVPQTDPSKDSVMTVTHKALPINS